MRNILLFALIASTLLYAGCTSKNSPKNFAIVKYINIADNKADADMYHFDASPNIAYDSSYYRHVDSAVYMDGTIHELNLFKPDGPYTINKQELMADTSLLTSFDLTVNRTIKIKDNAIVDNGTTIDGNKLADGEFAYVKGLYLYKYIALDY